MYISLAPAFSPNISKNPVIGFNTILVYWSYPSESDTYGFVLNISTPTNDYRIIKVDGSNVTQFTIEGLNHSSQYDISIRAFQDLLGPPSKLLSTRTANGELKHSMIEISSILWFSAHAK